MRKTKLLIMALAGAGMSSQAATAQSSYVTVTYQGTIEKLYDGSDFSPGEKIFASVTFDPAKLVDHTASANSVLKDVLHNSLSFASVLTASLSDDPKASLSFYVGDNQFNKFDQLNYGSPNDDAPFNLGSGNFPLADYLNGQFKGISGTFQNTQGTYLATDPIAAALGYIDGYDFYIGTDSTDAEGNFDFRNAVYSVAAVPEPASWAMLIGGFALIGASLRRRRPYRAKLAYTF